MAMSTNNRRAHLLSTGIKTSAVALLVGFASVACAFQASAQGGFSSTSQSARKGLGDGSSFYMSRRQLQFVDDSPIIRNSNGQVQSGTGAGFGNAPVGQQPLQRAGFTSYSSSLPTSAAPSLPKVNNGVPVQSAPPAAPKSLSAKAGGLGKGKKAAAKPAAPGKAPAQPEGIHAYNSYNGYNPSALAPGEAAGGGGSGSVTTRQGNVKGSVLHWSRRRRAQ